MIYFKNLSGEVFAYENQAERDQFGAPDLVVMTPGEVSAHLAPKQLTHEQIIEGIRSAIQKHMDDAARAYGYDDVKAAVTYADEPAVPKFQLEGRAFRVWRSLVWAHAYQVLDDVQSGARPQPTAEEIIAELPALSVEYQTA